MNQARLRGVYGRLRFFIEAIALFFYEIFSTSSEHLPPMIGFCFAFMVLEYHSKTRQVKKLDISWYSAVAFLLFAEQIHGLYLFSTLIAFMIFYTMFFGWLYVWLKSRNGLLVIFVVAGYVFSWAVGSVFCYIQSEELLPFGLEYLLYMALESFFAMIFLRKWMR